MSKKETPPIDKKPTVEELKANAFDISQEIQRLQQGYNQIVTAIAEKAKTKT